MMDHRAQSYKDRSMASEAWEISHWPLNKHVAVKQTCGVRIEKTIEDRDKKEGRNQIICSNLGKYS